MPLLVDLEFSDGRSMEVNVQGRLSLSLLLYVNPPRPNQLSPGGEKPDGTLCYRLEFVVQAGPHNMPLIVRFPPESADVPCKDIRLGAEALVVERVIEILGFDRPVTADHSLDAAANGPAPVKVLFMGIDRSVAARENIAIVAYARVPIDPNATPGRVKQPLIERDAEAAADGRVEIAVTVAH